MSPYRSRLPERVRMRAESMGDAGVLETLLDRGANAIARLGTVYFFRIHTCVLPNKEMPI